MRLSVALPASATESFEHRALALLPDDALDPELGHCFASCLTKFFRALPGNVPHRYWSVDDFSLEEVSGEARALSLSGQLSWFEGGEACSVVRLDVGLETEPLLYSFKFFPSLDGPQVLYIAKERDRWILSAV